MAVVNEQEARSITLQDKPDVEVLETRLGINRGNSCMEVNYVSNQHVLVVTMFQRKMVKWIKDIENI